MRPKRRFQELAIFSAPLVALTLIGLWLPQTAQAGVTGTIAGQAVDDRTDQPIENVKVEVVGASVDAITDEDGEYYILEMPAGEFTLLFTAPGYLSVTKEHARVLLDLTTPVNVRMVAREANFSEPITVIADRPLVQKDLTGTRYTVTAEQMAFLPNAINVDDVLLNVSGTLSDQDGNLHVRGGRAGAVTYIYDGVQVTDPFTRTLGLRIVPHFLEEINLTSGGFPAEYGEAGSGVVNAVTREGNDLYTGSIKVYDGSTHKYDRFSGDIGSLERSDNQALSVNFSGPLDPIGVKNTTFFVAAEGLRDGGFLPHSFTETRTLTGKLSTHPRANLKLTATGTYSDSEGEDYDHRDINRISYDLNLDGLGLRKRDALSLGLRANYAYDRETFFQIGISRFETKTKIAPTHLFDLYWNQWPGFVADSTGAYDPANGTLHQDNYNAAPEYGFTGYTFGDDFLPLYSLRSTKYSSANFSVTHQVDKRNQTKVGAELRTYHIFWDEKQFFNATPFGEKFDYYPSYGYAFVQHKLVYEDVIINAGLRFDRFSSRVRFVDPFLFNSTVFRESTPKSQFSPRIGVSHPVAENTILRFNYGYFFEPPLFISLYTNLDNEINSGFPLVGDPDLKPQKTIAYELGLDHSLSDDLVLGVTAYFKDLKDLTATRRVFPTDSAQFSAANGIVTRFINEDYASVKGLDVSLTKRRTRYFSGRLSYSLMVARGNSPEPRFAYENFITGSDTTLPTSPYDLDFDQRHTLVVNADVRTPYDWKGKLFGAIPLSGAWGASVVTRYGSGRPFTKENPVTQLQEGGRNEFRMPFTLVVDTRVNRDFRFGDSRYSLSVFFEVENLLNRRNIVNVYSNGLPNTDGTNVRDGGVLLSADETERLNNLILNDPQNYSAPRQIRLGMQLNF